MKILHLIYTNGIAGAEKYLVHLLPQLKNDHGVDCHLITVCAPGYEGPLKEYCQWIQDAGISTSLIIAGHKDFFRTARAISKYLQKHDIHYLHSHLLNSDVLATLVKVFFNKKLILISTKHGYRESILKHITNTEDMSFIRNKAKKELYYHVTKYVVAKADHNYAVSHAYSKLFYELGLSKAVMPFIHHGVTVKEQPIESRPNEYRFSDVQLTVVGRLEEVKGHKYLLQAMPEVVKKFPECKLVIIGQGADQQYLQELAHSLKIADNILFLGFKTNPYSYIANSDVIVSPFLFESFGLVYIEAFALNTPIVAFDTPAGNEIMVNKETALLVPARDVNGLARQILYLLENPAEAKALAARAHQAYKENFTTERMVKETAAFYKKITTV